MAMFVYHIQVPTHLKDKPILLVESLLLFIIIVSLVLFTKMGPFFKKGFFSLHVTWHILNLGRVLELNLNSMIKTELTRRQ